MKTSLYGARFSPYQRNTLGLSPPPKFKIDPYYAKFTYAREFVVLGSKQVSDAALLEANDTIRKMFAYRHDILKALINDGARLVILAPGEKVADLPEVRAAKAFDDVRYLDYDPKLKLMVVPEENVLGSRGDPFAGRCMVIAAFAKGLLAVTGQRPVIPGFGRGRDVQQYELRVRRLDVEFDARLKKLYDAAMEKVRAEWPPASLSQEQIAELRASREEAYWVARFRQVREVIDCFYPEVPRR